MSRGLRGWITALATTAFGCAASAAGAAPVFEQPLQSVPIGIEPQDVSIIDIDRDGSLDLVVTDHGNQLYVLHNNGAGSFTLSISEATFGIPLALLAMDIDRDDWPDPVVLCSPGYVNVFRNNSGSDLDRRFSALHSTSDAGGVAGDFDEDSHPDVLGMALDEPCSLSYARGNASLQLDDAVRYNSDVCSGKLASADVDGDGHLDLVLSGTDGLFLRRGYGDGFFESEEPLPVTSLPGVAKIADVNGDSQPDLVVVGAVAGSAFAVYFGQDGNLVLHGGFGAYPRPETLTVGDIDGDGDLDVVVLDTESHVRIFHGDGRGEFVAARTYAAGGRSTDVECADLDSDGRSEIVVPNPDEGRVAILHANADGTYGGGTNLENPAPLHAVLGSDLDGDGLADIAATQRGVVSLWRGRGDGTFATPIDVNAGIEAVALAAGRLDADALPDLVVAAPAADAVEVLRGLGGGAFASPLEYPCGERPSAVVLADFDADGWLDVAVANRGHDNATLYVVSVRRGLGDGTLGPSLFFDVPARPVDLAAGDLDGDGKLDLAVACGGANAIAFLLGNGDCTFHRAPDLVTAGAPRAVALADVNGDGRLDVTVAQDAVHGAELHRGLGDGRYTTETLRLDGAADDVTFADVDLDGRLEIVVTQHDAGSTAVFTLTADRLHRSLEIFSRDPVSLALAPFDGDARPDLAVASDRGDGIWVLRNLSERVPVAVQDLASCPCFDPEWRRA